VGSKYPCPTIPDISVILGTTWTKNLDLGHPAGTEHFAGNPPCRVLPDHILPFLQVPLSPLIEMIVAKGRFACCVQQLQQILACVMVLYFVYWQC
jgi:hypothetical protein